jgi:hypothetical protein
MPVRTITHKRVLTEAAALRSRNENQQKTIIRMCDERDVLRQELGVQRAQCNSLSNLAKLVAAQRDDARTQITKALQVVAGSRLALAKDVRVILREASALDAPPAAPAPAPVPVTAKKVAAATAARKRVTPAKAKPKAKAAAKGAPKPRAKA